MILLVIVGAWLAFFVQLALRSETTDVHGTVDRFHDAMRVLSRRQTAARPGERGLHGTPGRVPGPGLDPGPGTPAAVPAARRTSAVAGHRPATATCDDRRARAAARRARLLTGLVVTAVATLLGAAVLSWWLLVPHVLADLLLAGVVVHLRRRSQRRSAADQRLAETLDRAHDRAHEQAQAVLSTQAVARPAEARPEPGVHHAVVRHPVVRHPVRIHVAGVPDRMPPRPRPLPGLLPAAQAAPPAVPAARSEQVPEPVRGAQGAAWSPVPLPVPTYLSAPPAPRRVLDLTRPAGAVERRPSAAPEVGLHDLVPAVEAPVEHRWAVND